jgi:hypothetical protein
MDINLNPNEKNVDLIGYSSTMKSLNEYEVEE